MLLRTGIFDIFAPRSRIFSLFRHGTNHIWSKLSKLAHICHIHSGNLLQCFYLAILKGYLKVFSRSLPINFSTLFCDFFSRGPRIFRREPRF